MAYRRHKRANLHVRGYKEKGNINTPLDLAISNEIDGFSLAIDVINCVPRFQVAGTHAKERFRNMQIACRNDENGIGRTEIVEWRWPAESPR